MYINFGGGNYMIRLKKVYWGVSILALVTGVSILTQTYTNTYAANTLLGNNEVITIGDTTDGLPVNATVTAESYSSDGNIILFSSNATNLPDAGGSGGLYTYNISTTATKRVDISTSGVYPNGGLFAVGGGANARMSETGRYVTFGSWATNLIDGSTQPLRMIYKRDTQTGQTTLVGAGYTGGYSDKWDRNLDVSNDGRLILVSSRYLANGYPNNYGYALGDNTSGAYSWTSLGTDDYYANSGTGDLSCDGAFAVIKKNSQILLNDLRKGSTTTLTAGGYTSVSPIISCNGRYVLYATTNRTDITTTPSGMNSYLHLVRYDRITGERKYIDSNSSDVFSTSNLSYNSTYSNVQSNIFNASISDSGDAVFSYNGNTYLKHLSDGSGTLESLAKTTSGTYVNVANGTITNDGRYLFFTADPYTLGLTPSPSSNQIIRTKTGI